MARFLRWFIYLIGFIALVFVLLYAAAQFYKPTILEAINDRIKKNINGDFKIGNLDFTFFEEFPNLSITLSDIYLRGASYDRYHKDLFTAKKIYIRSQPLLLFQGRVSLNSLIIKGGEVFIFKSHDGYSDRRTFKKTDVPDSVKQKERAMSLDFGTIKIENSRFTLVDSAKGKSFDLKLIDTTLGIVSKDSSREFSLAGKMWFGGLVFNDKRGGYLTNTNTEAKLYVEFFPNRKELIVMPSELQFKKSTVKLSGQFNLKPNGNYVLFISSDKIDYAEGLTLVPHVLKDKLSKYNFAKPVTLSMKVAGGLAPGKEPKINMSFSTKMNQFTVNKLELKDLSFAGTYINHLDSTRENGDPNSRILLETVSAKLKGFPLEAKLSIVNLKDPSLDLEAHCQANLSALNTESDVSKLKFISGEFKSNLIYKGKLNEMFDPNSKTHKGKLQGDITISQGSLVMTEQQKKFDAVDVQINFTEKQVNLEKINFKINGNPVAVKGSVMGFMPFFTKPEKQGRIDLILYSPRVNLATLVKKKKSKPGKLSAKPKEKKPTKIAELLDVLHNDVLFNVDLKVDEVVNDHFKATNLTAKINLVKDEFSAEPIEMQVAGGVIKFSLKMTDLDKPATPVALKADIVNADISKLFVSFDNFSQPAIKSNNISGKVSAKVQLRAKVDDQFKVLMPTMRGKVDLRIRNGRLRNFEPLQNMSNFLLKKRDFSDVKFAEIRGHFGIYGLSIDIGRMEIQSTVLTLFLEGKYSTTDKTDLAIQVPLSNLKKRDKTYKPKNVGVDAKVGPSVFLRARSNKEGKIDIAYDPFKKFRKK